MRHSRKRGFLACLVLFSIFLILLIVPASAAPAEVPTDGISDAMMIGYTLIRNASAALATVGVAISGVTMLLGTGKAAEQARTSMQYCLLALACILLLPEVIAFGKSLLG